MNIIALQSDGRLSHANRRVEGDALPFLGYQVTLDADYSLRSFFRMMVIYPLLARLNPFSGSFLTDYRNCLEQGCRHDGDVHLELSRTVEMIGYPGSPSMQIFVNFEGRRDGNICDIKSFGLEQLLDLPLRLGRLKHMVFGDKMDSLDFETDFNLFELIDGICWQLGFHNRPEQCRIS